MDFRIRQLECFLVLAEKLNYGQAARAQYMTQPTLSFQIKSLEEDFGARLFDRSHKGVTLTTAGEHLAVSARRILTEIESVHRQISGLTAQEPLRVCCSQAGQFEILPRLMRRLAETTPQLRLEVHRTIPEERLKALSDGKLDVLMMVSPVEAPGLSFQVLRRESLMAVVPDTVENHNRRNISIRELAKSPLLVANEKECRHCKQFTLGILQRFNLLPEVIETPIDFNFQCAMVASGKGVLISSESMLGLRFPGVRFLPFEESIPKSKLGVAWRTNDMSESLRVFHEALVALACRNSTESEMASLPSLIAIRELEPVDVDARHVPVTRIQPA